MVKEYEDALQEAGIVTHRLSRSKSEDHEAVGLRLATMHRVKGLEFDRLVVAGVNDGVVPLAVGELKSDDGAVREEAEKRERALFYVAVTRARREVLITSYGKPSPWLVESEAVGIIPCIVQFLGYDHQFIGHLLDVLTRVLLRSFAPKLCLHVIVCLGGGCN